MQKQFIIILFLLLSIGAAAQKKNRPVWPYGGVPDQSRKKMWSMKKAPLNFDTPVDFGRSRFFSAADFPRARFNRSADFWEVNFSHSADFSSACFAGKADFNKSDFLRSGNFSEAYFMDLADFRWSQFMNLADFSKTNFACSADFIGGSFANSTDFNRANFAGPADFNWSHFTGLVDFSRVYFDSSADFIGARFDSSADFNWGRFRGRADFSWACFNRPVNFGEVQFGNSVNFREAQFQNKVHFTDTRFRNTIDLEHARFYKGLDFTEADIDSVSAIHLFGIEYPKGKFFVYWEQLKAARKLRLTLQAPPVDTTAAQCREHYQKIAKMYHKLRDNFLAQNNPNDADAVMYELGWQRQKILKEWSWWLYGWCFGWGYRPWKFFTYVVIPILLLFSSLWFTCYYPIIHYIIYQDKSAFASIQKTAGKNVFQRILHVLFFSGSILVSLRLKKNWLVKKNDFLFWVTLEWVIGIGLYILFVLMIKTSQLAFIKGFLGF